MSIIHWNIRSLNANYTAGLAVLLTSINPSVVCLQETKLPADYSNIAGTTIAGYKAFHQIYSGGDIACGGTSIYIKKQYSASPHSSDNPPPSDSLQSNIKKTDHSLFSVSTTRFKFTY